MLPITPKNEITEMLSAGYTKYVAKCWDPINVNAGDIVIYYSNWWTSYGDDIIDIMFVVSRKDRIITLWSTNENCILALYGTELNINGLIEHIKNPR